MLRALVAAVALVWLAAPYWPRHLDDLDITLAYAYECRDHGVIAWTSGEVVEGYSNFLWLLLAEAAVLLHLDAVVCLKVASLVGGAGLLTVLSSRAPWDLRGHVLIAAVAMWAPLAYWSALGFETTTFALLLATGWALTLRGRRGAGLGLLALSALAHPEGHAHLIVAGLMSVHRDGRPKLGRTEDRLAGAAIGALGLYHVWRVAHFGHVLPTPYLVKVASIAPGLAGFAQLGREGLSAVGIGAAILALRPARRAIPWIAAPLLLQGLLLLRANGDWMAWGRFLLPGVAAAALCAADAAPRQAPKATWSVLVAALLALLAAAWQPEQGRLGSRLTRDLLSPGASLRSGIDTPAPLDAEWIIENIPPGEVLLTGDVGLVGNIDAVRVRDLAGLVDRRFAEAIVDRRPFVQTEWSDVYGTAPGCVSFMRLVNRDRRDQRAATPWLGAIYPFASDVWGPDYRVQWLASHAHKPSYEVIARRWIALAERFPSQPWLRWRAHLAHADLRDEPLTGSDPYAGAFPALAALGESTTFTHGPTPLTWTPGLGFALFWNATLTSRPLSEADQAGVLVLRAQDPGLEGALARVGLGACSATVAVMDEYRAPLRSLCAGTAPGDRLTVEFLNDQAAEGRDRNLFVALELP